MTQKTAKTLRCSNGANCVAYPTLGEPSKLSSGNPGPRCFACEERRVASELEAHSAKSKAAEPRATNEPLRSEGRPPGVRICAEYSCGRPAVEQEGQEGGAFVCREHAEVRRASAIRERRKASVLTCERGLRSAIASGDERLARRWSMSLADAEARLLWAEADLEVAEEKARSEHA